jgi:hypothetical protein
MIRKLHSFAAVAIASSVCAASSQAAAISGSITYAGNQTGKVVVRAAQTLPGNKVVTLDGVDDFVRIDSLRDLSGSELSIGYWFKGNSIQSAVRQQSGGFIIAGWNNLHVVSNDGGTSGVSAGEGVNDGAWHHLLFTWKQGTAGGFSSYLDGKLVARRDSANSAIPNHNAPVYFGTLGEVAEFTDGSLDEITIWRRALTDQEVTANWNRKYTGTETGLIGLWKFDDDTPNDSGPSQHLGQLFSGAFIQDEGIPGLGGGSAKVDLNAPGAFTIGSLPDGANYSVTAFLDVNGNGRQDPDEPFGNYSGNPFTLVEDKTGVNIELAGAPLIATQPSGGRFSAGSTVRLSVAAEGIGPFTYTWLKDDAPLGDAGNVAGSKTAELTLNNVTPADTGVYSVTVANAIGSITSEAALVLIVSGGATVSGNVSYTGTQTGALHVLVAQREGGNRVLKLDGAGDTVATALTDLSGSELTIQFWFKGPTPQSVVRQQGGGYIVAGWNGLHILSHDRGTTGVSMGNNVTDGGWHHVIMTWKQNSPGGFASYLDGRLVTRRDSAAGAIPNHNAQVYFGSLNNGGEFTTGMVDEIAIWNKALTAGEVAGKWSQPLTGAESGLVGYWDFNDDTAADRSPNGYHGDLLGDAAILAQDIPTLGSFYPAVFESGSAFELRNIPLGENYFITAFIDANGNGLQDAAEPSGSFSSQPIALGGDRTGLNVTLTEIPRVISQPSPQRVTAGQPVQLSVGATGTGPLSYQWLRNGQSIAADGRISGATQSQLQISAVEAADAGLYSVRVTNAQGETISREVALVVAPAGLSISGEIRYAGELPGRVVVTTQRFKPGNKALKLDGDGDTVRVTELTDLSGNELTIAFWFKGNSAQSAVRQQNAGFIIAGWNNMHILSNDGGTGGIHAGNGITDGNWHHLALTWEVGEANGFSSYLDGRLVATRDSSFDALPALNAALYFGSLNGAGEFMNGQLDEIGIWNRALTAAEVNDISTRILSGSEEGLIGFWNFDQGDARDLSPAARNGEFAGDATTVDAAIPGLGGARFTDEFASAGAFTISNLPAGDNYFLTAFVDENGDLLPGENEAQVTFDANPFNLTSNRTGVVLDFGGGAGPALSVGKTGNTIQLTWPASATGYRLESATALTPSGWGPVTGVVGSQHELALDGQARFFRLVKP